MRWMLKILVYPLIHTRVPGVHASHAPFLSSVPAGQLSKQPEICVVCHQRDRHVKRLLWLPKS